MYARRNGPLHPPNFGFIHNTLQLCIVCKWKNLSLFLHSRNPVMFSIANPVNQHLPVSFHFSNLVLQVVWVWRKWTNWTQRAISKSNNTRFIQLSQQLHTSAAAALTYYWTLLEILKTKEEDTVPWYNDEGSHFSFHNVCMFLLGKDSLPGPCASHH